MKEADYDKRIFYILVFFAAVLIGVLLKITVTVSLPVTVAVLLSCVLYPVIKNLNEKLHIPWIFASILMMLLMITVLSLLSTIIGTSLTAFLDQYPNYESKFNSIYKIFADTLNLQFYEDKSFFENIWSQLKVREFVQKTAISVSSNLISITRSLGVILLLTVFFLIELRNSREKVNYMFNGKFQSRFLKITKKVIMETVHFVSIKFFISLATGLLVYISCLIAGLNFAIIWGFLAFVFNFIPTFGSIFSVGMMTMFALLQFYPSPLPTVFILTVTTLINLILGNIVEPKIEGQNLGLSPFVILVSLLFWGWMWGFIGMILAVPVMVILKIICENVSYLHWAAILLGNKPTDTQKELSVEEDS